MGVRQGKRVVWGETEKRAPKSVQVLASTIPAGHRHCPLMANQGLAMGPSSAKGQVTPPPPAHSAGLNTDLQFNIQGLGDGDPD